MQVLGLGTDVVDIHRIDDALLRHGQAFAKRILAAGEMAIYLELAESASRQCEFVAGRFAAKEALAKAIGCGLGGLGLTRVHLQLTQGGLAPIWQGSLPSGVAEADQFLVSLSHSRLVATSTALWMRA